MNDPRHQLTPALQRQICSYICAGGFAHVAAEAAGVPVKVFERWMAWGQAERPVALYRDFYEAVRQAEAMTRLAAESKTFQKASLSWLRSGPGRATAQTPGWTSPVKALPLAQAESKMPPEELFALCRAVLEALLPFPEARMAVAAKLMEGGWDKDPAAEAMAECAGVEMPEPDNEAAPAGTPGEEPATAPEVPESGVPVTKASDVAAARSDSEQQPAAAGADGLWGYETKCMDFGAMNLHRNRIEALLKAQRNEAEEAVKQVGEDGETAPKPGKRGLPPWHPLHCVVGFG